MATTASQQTGRYRFRKGWFGPVLQQERVDGDDVTTWQDVKRSSLVPERIFAIVRPSQWRAMIESEALKAQLDRVEAQRRAKAEADRKRRRKGQPEFEASRMAP